MKKFKSLKSLICMLLAIAMVMSLPIMGSIFAETTGSGLNGDTCAVSDFNYDIYDVLAGVEKVIKSTWTWPSSGNVMISVSGKYSFSDMDGVTIPAGLVVDVYGRDGGSNFVLLAHYDTTNGKSITVNTSDTSSGNNGNTGTSTETGTNTGNAGNTSTGNTNQTPMTYTHSYDDVQPGSWYYDAVMTLTEGGLFAGYGNGKFGPDDIITYGQLSIVMDRLTGGRMYGGEANIDLSTAENKVNMTRGLTAVRLKDMVLIYTTTPQYYFPNTAIASVEEFPDYDDIIAWCTEYEKSLPGFAPDVNASIQAIAKNYIYWSYEHRLFNGVDSAGTFDPYGTLTRAQLCQILYNKGWTTANCEYFVE